MLRQLVPRRVAAAALSVFLCLLQPGCAGGGSTGTAPSPAVAEAEAQLSATQTPTPQTVAETSPTPSPPPPPTPSPQPTSPLSANVVETWQVASFAVGLNAGNDSGATVLMANLVTLPGGAYRLYYNWSPPGMNLVKYADSTDLQTWTLKGVSLSGSADPADGEYVLGGANVHRLSDGRYRMYYRCSPYHADGTPPAYTVRSAISADGATFTREGIRIDIAQNDPSSPFSLAGHGAFYQLADGTWAGIFSGNRVGQDSASDLVLTTSPDGLTWGNFRTLYVGCHDPVVVPYQGKFRLYASYLREGPGRAISSDGLTWPTQLDPVHFVDSQGEAFAAGDLGALVTASGDLRLFSNYDGNHGIGSPTTDIVMCTPK